MKSKLIFILVLPVLLAGCTTGITREQKLIRAHVVDACYTTMEMSPADKKGRIEKYLQAYQNGGLLSEHEVFVLQECLNRTEQSERWKK